MNASTMTGAGFRSRASAAKIDYRRYMTPRNGLIAGAVLILALIVGLMIWNHYRWPAAFVIQPGGSVILHLEGTDAQRNAKSIDVAERIGVPVVVTPLGQDALPPTTDYDFVRANYSDTGRFLINIPVWAYDEVDPRARRINRADGTCDGIGCR